MAKKSEVTTWQKHTLRSEMSRTLRKKMELILIKVKQEGLTVYRLIES